METGVEDRGQEMRLDRLVRRGQIMEFGRYPESKGGERSGIFRKNEANGLKMLGSRQGDLI